MVYSYADYLRRYDALTSQIAELKSASKQKLIEGAVPFSDAIQFDKLRGLSVEEIYALPIEDEASKALARSQLLLGAAALLGMEQRNTIYRRDDGTDLIVPPEWPINHRVRVESLVVNRNVIVPLVASGGPDKQLVKSRRKNQNVVEAELWMVENKIEEGGMIHLYKSHRSLFGKYKTCIDVSPIIDRNNGYRANIKLTVLD